MGTKIRRRQIAKAEDVSHISLLHPGKDVDHKDLQGRCDYDSLHSEEESKGGSVVEETKSV
jgi:hypothetical protein